MAQLFAVCMGVFEMEQDPAPGGPHTQLAN